MPNCEAIKSAINSNKAVGGYKDVVIIGNGPSGLCLSYFLSGHWPYWNKNPVSDEYLQMRLNYLDNKNLSLVEQDLEMLSNGLEGRSLNQVALLYDKLKHPDGDLGMDSPTCLNWKYDPNKEIDHICIGKASGPGGAWNDLDGSQLTVSPSRWMELPELSYSEWKRQSKVLSNINAGLVFSSKTSNFSEDNSLLNANQVKKVNSKISLSRPLTTEDSRASMNDIRNYYRDYVKQKNMDKYLLNNATVTNVRRICCNKLLHNNSNDNCTVIPCNSSQIIQNSQNLECLWEVTGLIDKRDRKKASSLTHKGDLMEFKYYCKHLVLANGACDIHNELNVKGEKYRFILRSIRELEDKIKEDLPRLQKDPLMIIGSGLSAADAILLAKKYQIKIIHVIRKSVNDPSLIFNKLPKKVYPEYHRVYEQILNYKSQESEINNNNTNVNCQNYVLYDEHQVKYFTSKRTCILSNLSTQYYTNNNSGNSMMNKTNSASNFNRQMHIQKQLLFNHQKQLNDCDEEIENIQDGIEDYKIGDSEIKISYACILIGYSPDLSFLPPNIANQLAVDTSRSMNTKDNPICIDEYTHESSKFKNLYAMGPLVGDNFVRFGTGGALAITSSIWKKRVKK
ncbi:unnamed protein product [Brachionus calyciflorus]|uniref:Uncharacterized protein n=1 Tax=Brachionus calyciflorus TaxID=104777 RepID=A0A813SCY7_9BILA|nr:unnamed protein product [Brachionus calyciflorus]